ncbi:MAG: tripartite tricarboxylate transporter TctB family protein [Firmicutes bacterium]|nr:tripartite tricarboxylate transporter TctB family protein [Bacillota bacterium]
MNRNKGTGILSALLGIVVILYTMTIPNPRSTADMLGPRAFPYITGTLLVVCGIGLFLQKSDKEKPFLTKHQWKRLLAICSVYLAYSLLLWAFGFLIATPLCLFTLSTMFSAGKKVPWWGRILYAVGLTAVLYFCFFTLLGMSLPVGKFVRLII